ncbi:MAG: hypothetical protein ACKO03_06140 [Bacteroidota bacterium]
MASKKYSLILGFLTLVMAAQAQIAEWKDSSLIPPSSLAQHNEFVNNQYVFPAKPRSQWEVGLKLGSPSISGDVQAQMPNFGVGLHLRKSLGYLVSLRGEIMTGSAKGLTWKENNNYRFNTAWTSNGYNFNTDKVYYNYKTKLTDLSLQMLFNFTNINFNKLEHKFNMYAIVGIGMTLYDCNIDALNSSNGKYSFTSISGNVYARRNETLTALKAILDGTYETPAEQVTGGGPRMFGRNSRLSGTVGLGASFKLSKKINLAIEDRYTVVNDDLLDGQRWSPYPLNAPAFTPHWDTHNFLSVGLNVNIF